MEITAYLRGPHLVLPFLFLTEPFLDEMLQMALDTKEVMGIMPYLPGPHLALVGFSYRAGPFLDETLQTALLETREVLEI